MADKVVVRKIKNLIKYGEEYHPKCKRCRFGPLKCSKGLQPDHKCPDYEKHYKWRSQ